jgi:hypothetical protein
MIQSFTIHAFVTEPPRLVSAPSTLSLGMAGFGGAPSNKQKKELKIKPKAQWDRYTDMKKVPMVRVAVRKTDTDDWLEVGRVRAKDKVTTEIAVARQRALIADHARRLFPLQVSAKDKIEWAYWEGSDEDGSWIVVDKSAVEQAPEGVEKLIGFEGRPDPASGFYCVFDNGRLKADADELKK